MSTKPELGSRPARQESPWAKEFLVPLGISGLSLCLLFLGDMSYLFGSSLWQRQRTHALHVLAVDFDGGDTVSQALAASYNTLRSNEFPTVEFQNTSTHYPNPAAVREAVCRGGYWGAVYVHAGAAARLSGAAAGNASEPYQANDTITYIYNQARYTTTVESAIHSNLETLIEATRGTYYATAGGRAALVQLNRTDAAAVQAYLNPIQASPDVITPTLQGSRAFYNTLNIVFPILITFFFMLAVNGVGEAQGLARRLRRRQFWLLRFALGKVYALMAALVITAYIWAFREDWAVDTAVFSKNWMIVWFQVDINWQVFDAFIGTFVPVQFTSFFMLTWVVLNVTSAVFPIEMTPGFYRVSYAFPGRNIYALQVQAWTGCANEMKVALPILFAWWALGHIAGVFSLRKRCADALRRTADPLAFNQERSLSENTMADKAI